MPKKTQTLKNHARFSPLYHFVAFPLTTIYFAYTVYLAARSPNAATIIAAIYALAIVCAVLASRVFALTVQNRLIRLEMRLRLREILPAALQTRIKDLTVRQLIALRFAGDAELPSLVDRTLKGEFPKAREIKRAVTDWQADFLRV